MKYKGLFIGLTTLDLIYKVPHAPQANEKLVATDLEIAAGGPATNAAVTFGHFNNQALLLSVVGHHPLSELIRSDLSAQKVELQDLWPTRLAPPPLSSILVNDSTGERAVIARNAENVQVIPESSIESYLDSVDIVLIDGHQLEASLRIAQASCLRNIPVVLDGGSWKLGLEKLLPLVDHAVCSANFFPPSCNSSIETIQYLSQSLGHAAVNKAINPSISITKGEQPIQYLYQGQSGEIDVPKIKAIDTLGAGDTFHGAFCDAILETSFLEAITQAANVAALSCQSFGTREWLNK